MGDPARREGIGDRLWVIGDIGDRVVCCRFLVLGLVGNWVLGRVRILTFPY